MLTDPQKKMIVDSWRLVTPIAETAGDLFYRRLFELRPGYRKLFPDDMDRQRDKLVKMLSFIVKALDWGVEEWSEEIDPENDLFLVVLAMGRRHAALYKIPDSSYPDVGTALLWALDQGLGQAFTDEIQEAWTELYGILARVMIMGGSSSRLKTQFGTRS